MYKYVEDNKHHPHTRLEDPLWDNNEKKNKCISLKMFKEGYNYIWKLFEDGENVLDINSMYLPDAAVNFLFTPDGVNFVIRSYKAGCKNLITEIKKHVKNNF